MRGQLVQRAYTETNHERQELDVNEDVIPPCSSESRVWGPAGGLATSRSPPVCLGTNVGPPITVQHARESFQIVGASIDITRDHRRHALSQQALCTDSMENRIGASCRRGVFMGSIPSVDIIMSKLDTSSQAKLGDLDAARNV